MSDQDTTSKPSEIDVGFSAEDRSKQGTAFDLSTLDEAAKRQAVEESFDYRGDVTLKFADDDSVCGYVFDRRTVDGEPCLRLMLEDGSKRDIPFASVVHIEFTGRDPAAGRSFETWIRKWVTKKAAGESPEMKPLPLEE